MAWPLLVCAKLVREEVPFSVIATKEVDETMVTRQVLEAPVSLLPGSFKVDPGLDLSTVTRGK